MQPNTSLTRLGLGICGLLLLAAAPSSADVAGSKDHPLISRFEGSEIIGYDHRNYNEFTLALGPQTRNQNDDIVLAKEQHIEGEVTRILYLTPADHTTLEVYRSYQHAMLGAGFEELFSCSANACGMLFQYVPTFDSELYEYTLKGHFRDQRYLAAKLVTDQSEIYVSLFVFEHESPHSQLVGRALVQLDVIEIERMKEGQVTVNAEAMARDIQTAGHTALYGIYFDTDKAEVKPASEPTLKEIAALLTNAADLQLYVVGHTDSQGGFAHNQTLSQHRAEAVVEVLTSRYGIAAERLHARGVAFLAPVASNADEAGRAKNRRVELVAF